MVAYKFGTLPHSLSWEEREDVDISATDFIKKISNNINSSLFLRVELVPTCREVRGEFVLQPLRVSSSVCLNKN